MAVSSALGVVKSALLRSTIASVVPAFVLYMSVYTWHSHDAAQVRRVAQPPNLQIK